MANISVGDFVIINRSYVEEILPTLSFQNKATTLTGLGNIGESPAEITDMGTAPIVGGSLQYVCLTPTNKASTAYRGGRGICVYFPSNTVKCNSFDLTTSIISDKCFIKVINTSGSTITRSSVVRQTGFDTSQQLATVDLASAGAASTANALGVAVADIANGACGSVLVDGAFCGFDTSMFAIQDTVFLSDTPGAIATAAGSTNSIVGRVTSVDATDGCIFFNPTFGSGGGGGGSMGATGISGTTGISGGSTPLTVTDSDTTLSLLDTLNFPDNTEAVTLGSTGIADIRMWFATDPGNSEGVIATADGGSTPTTYGTNVLAVGDSSYAGGNNTFVWGASQSVGGGPFGYSNCFVGYGNSGSAGPGYGYQLQAFGNYNSLTGRRIFAAGNDNDTSGAKYNENIMMQGTSNEAYGYNLFMQGRSNDLDNGSSYLESCFAQGQNNTIESSYSFAQGRDIDLASTHNFGQGQNLETSGVSPRTFMQGRNINLVGVTGVGSENNFAQGDGITMIGTVEESFAQGDTISVTGSHTFTQGYSLTASGNRAFVQGVYATATQDDQKVWGSNRTGVAGGAQSSHIVRYLNTANATTTTLATIATVTDKSYAVQCKIIARNTTTNGESTSFMLAQATAYNDAGTAVLVGSPVFTAADSGGGSSSWTAIIDASGTDIRIRVTGDTTDSVQWCCDLEFVEVSG